LKPPVSWDDEVIPVYQLWFQEGVPPVLLKTTAEGGKGGLAVVQDLWRKAIRQIRSTLPDKTM